jgi:hypothetical protein
VRRDVAADLRARLLAWLEAYARNESALHALAAARDHARAGLDAATAHAYLAGIHCVLDADALAGQALYERELAANPWIDERLAATPSSLITTGA